VVLNGSLEWLCTEAVRRMYIANTRGQRGGDGIMLQAAVIAWCCILYLALVAGQRVILLGALPCLIGGGPALVLMGQKLEDGMEEVSPGIRR
jgi:hypothetical protein